MEGLGRCFRFREDFPEVRDGLPILVVESRVEMKVYRR